MSSTYNEIKRILFSERELDINKINEYLDFFIEIYFYYCCPVKLEKA